MVLLHIAHIETAIAGGVNIAVPKIVNAQKEFATVGIVNLTGESIESIPTFSVADCLELKLTPPFNKPDLVIFHEVYRPAFLKIAGFLFEKKIPYIVIPHGCLTKTAQRKKALKKWTANLLLFKNFLKKARSIQYLSQREQEQSVCSYSWLISPNGITLPDPKNERTTNAETKLLYIGRLEWKIKGFDLMLGAVSDQKELMRKNNAILTIYGPCDDPSREKLKKMIASHGISDLVNLQGEVWGEDKKQAFLNSDYFIQTSRSEGMPMGLLEAMSHGLPVIVTEGTGFAEIVTKNNCGFGCKTNKEEIAFAIEKAILKKDGYQALCQNARTLIETNYEEKAVAKNAVDAYLALLS